MDFSKSFILGIIDIVEKIMKRKRIEIFSKILRKLIKGEIYND